MTSGSAILHVMRGRLSLKIILMAGMVGLVSVTVILIAVSTFVSSKTVFLTHAKDIMENIASYTIDKSLNYLRPAKDAAQLTSGLADNRIVTSENTTAMEQYFYEQLRLYPQFSGIYYGNTEGEFIMASRYSDRPDAAFFTKFITYQDSTRDVRVYYRDENLDLLASIETPEDLYDPRLRPWFNSASAQKELIWTDPYVFFTSRKPGITTASPVFDADGTLRGVVGVDIEIDELSLFIASLKIGENGKAFILHENGDVIAFHDIEKLTHSVGNGERLGLVTINKIDDPASRMAYKTLVHNYPGHQLKERQFVSFDIDGKTYHGMFAPFDAQYWPWMFGVYIPEEDYLGVLNENLINNLNIAILLALISSLAGWILASSISRSMEQIRQGVQLIRKKDFSSPLNINSPYREIQETGDSFSAMRQELQSYSQNMQNLVKKRTTDLEKSNAELCDEIDRRKRTQKELYKAVEEAKRANEAKSTFLANISHEIRTPLNGIMGFAELMLNARVEEQKHGYVNTIIQESERLLLLINQLLDISRIESGKIELEENAFRLRDVFDAMKRSFEKEISKKNLAFIIEIDEQIPEYLYGDSLRFSQILMNLLSNAVKFTEKGSINLLCELVSEAGNSIILRCTICDTGIGISPEKQEMVFESFTQADASISRKYGGTGLGITIARELVGLMNGSMNLHSTPGEGSCFSFTVAMALEASDTQRDTRKQPHTPAFSLADRRVLIVEDYSVNREILAGFLTQLDAEILCATDGFEALEIYNENHIDLILMDVNMPGLNGIETTRRIREMGDISTPIIGVTAHAFSWELDKCLDNGMTSVVTKPFRKADLFESIQAALGIEGIPLSDNNQQHEDTKLEKTALQLLSEELGGNRSLAISIRNEFVQTLPVDMEDINRSWKSGDLATAHRLAHSLASGAGNVFETELMSIIRELELFLKNTMESKDSGRFGSDQQKYFNRLYNRVRLQIGRIAV